jgi:predicted nucleotidyltransferase
MLRRRGLTVFSLIGGVGVPTEVDLFVEEPFPFEDLWAKRTEKAIDGITVNIIDLDSLIALKKLAGRPQDLDDVRALEKFNQ